MNNQEFFKRLVKYGLEGIAVALASLSIPKRSLNFEDVISIAITAAATLAVLETFAPSIAVGARQGAGFGIGAKLSGYNLPMPSMLPAAAPVTVVPAGATP